MSYLTSGSGHRVDLLPNRVYVMGRGEECDLQIDDPGCSRKHARILVSGDARVIFVEDLESKNGTFCNGQRILGRLQLRDGDEVHVGNTKYKAHIQPGAPTTDPDTHTVIFKKQRAD